MVRRGCVGKVNPWQECGGSARIRSCASAESGTTEGHSCPRPSETKGQTFCGPQRQKDRPFAGLSGVVGERADTVMSEGGTTNGTNQHEWLRNRRIRTFVKFVIFVENRARRNMTNGQTSSHRGLLLRCASPCGKIRRRAGGPGASKGSWAGVFRPTHPLWSGGRPGGTIGA